MIRVLSLFIIINSQLAYGYQSEQKYQSQDQVLVATQYGWGDNTKAKHIRAAAVHVFNSPTDDDIVVVLDGDDSIYAHRLSEAEIQNLSYTQAILVNEKEVVYDLLDAETYTYFVPTEFKARTERQMVSATEVHLFSSEQAGHIYDIMVVLDADSNVYAVLGDEGGFSYRDSAFINDIIVTDASGAELPRSSLVTKAFVYDFVNATVHLYPKS